MKQQESLIHKVLNFISLNGGKKLIEDVNFLTRVIKKDPIKYGSLVVVAFLYLLNPLDVLPDTIPVLGLTDDASVIAVAVATIKKMMSN